MSSQFTNLVKSSTTGDYITPFNFYSKLDSIFKFDIDAATFDFNPLKTKRFFTLEDNGLKKEWNGNTWCNPPFGKQRGIEKWIEKMHDEATHHPEFVYVMLLPMRLESNWFQNKIWYNKQTSRVDIIHLIQGRLSFMSVNQTVSNSHILGSMLWIAGGYTDKQIENLNKEIKGITIRNETK